MADNFTIGHKVLLRSKDDFLGNPVLAGEHQDFMVSPGFQGAAKTAMLHFTLTRDLNDGRSVLMIQGAKLFLEELMNLGNPTLPREQPKTKMLDPV